MKLKVWVLLASVLVLLLTSIGCLVVCLWLFSLREEPLEAKLHPVVTVQAVYPGASAEVVAETVAAPFEQQVLGVEHIRYVWSQCGNDGSYHLHVAFEPGTDLDVARVLVQNRVALAQPMLPDLVQRQGITVERQSRNCPCLTGFVKQRTMPTSVTCFT